MSSNMNLSFHAPAAALGGVDAVGGAAGTNGMFSRLHLVGNPDWMSSFSSSQQVAAARPVLAPPAPVASASAPPRPLAAPAAIGAPAPAAKGFFSMFYRAPTSASSSAAAEVTRANRASTADGGGAAAAPLMPAPPKALDTLDSPPQRAMPVDAHLSLDHFTRSGVVEASMPAVRHREPPRPLALGSDTWNALSSVPLPPRTVSTATGKHVLSPPAAVDGFATRAPKPLWSDLSFTSRFRSSAPTLDAFRNVAPPTPITSSPVETSLPQPLLTTSAAAAAPVPVPPKPVTTSPLRDTANSSVNADAVASHATQRREPLRAHPLVPIGEEAVAAAPVTPLLKPDAEAVPAPSLARVMTTPASPLGAASEGDASTQRRPGAVSPVLADFVKSIAEPAAQQEQREEAVAAANVRNFLSTIFSRDEDAEATTTTTTASKADAFNALELAINRSGAPAKATQPLSYSTFATSPLFMDNNDEDSDEGMERLRRVVSIVMQAAKTHDGTTSQPASQTQRRSGNNGGTAASSPVPSRYTEFSATYHTSTAGSGNAAESEWMQYARF